MRAVRIRIADALYDRQAAGVIQFLETRQACVQRQVIEGRVRIAIQIAVVETLTDDGQDVRLAKGELGKLIEIQSMIEQYRQVIVAAIYRDHDALC